MPKGAMQGCQRPIDHTHVSRTGEEATSLSRLSGDLLPHEKERVLVIKSESGESARAKIKCVGSCYTTASQVGAHVDPYTFKNTLNASAMTQGRTPSYAKERIGNHTCVQQLPHMELTVEACRFNTFYSLTKHRSSHVCWRSETYLTGL